MATGISAVLLRVPSESGQDMMNDPLIGAFDFWTSLGNKKLSLEPEAVVVALNEGLVTIVSDATDLGKVKV